MRKTSRLLQYNNPLERFSSGLSKKFIQIRMASHPNICILSRIKLTGV
jgi:hypothetical protein